MKATTRGLRQELVFYNHLAADAGPTHPAASQPLAGAEPPRGCLISFKVGIDHLPAPNLIQLKSALGAIWAFGLPHFVRDA